MTFIYVLIGIFFAGIALLVSMPFVPIVRVFTNSSNERMTEAINSTWAAGTPLESIIHLSAFWAIVVIMICVALIVVIVSSRGN